MKAWLLAALAAAGSASAEPVPPPAPAGVETTAAATQETAEADDDADSEVEETEPAGATLTEREQRRLDRQERRRLRRATRRARRAAGGAGSETPAALDKGGQVSMEKARKMGDALKKSLADPSALGEALSGEGGGGSDSSAGGIAGAMKEGMKQLPDPTKPRTQEDLLAAARSGYMDSFNELGLKVGRDGAGKPSIVRSDGAPASEADLKTLSERIGAEPRALLRRPDFFKVVSREKFTDLKKDYKATPEPGEGVFKHVKLEEERDFVWSRSCSILAGGCNRYASASSYQGGHDVPPEDLRSFWNAQHGEPATAPPAEAVKVDAAGIRGRLKTVLSAIRSAFDGNSTKGGSGAGAPSAPAVAGGGWDFKPGEVAETSEARDKRLGRVGDAGEIQSASMVEAVPRKARLPLAGAGLLGAFGLLLVLRRRAS